MSFFDKKEVKKPALKDEVCIPLSPSTLAFYEPIDHPNYRAGIKKQFALMSEEFNLFKGRLGVLDDHCQIIGELSEKERGKLLEWVGRYNEICDKYQEVIAFENPEANSRSCMIL